MFFCVLGVHILSLTLLFLHETFYYLGGNVYFCNVSNYIMCICTVLLLHIS